MLDKGSDRPARLLEVNPAETRALAERLASDGLIAEAGVYLARSHVAESQITAYHDLLEQTCRYAATADRHPYRTPERVQIARDLFDELVLLGWSPPELLEQNTAPQTAVDAATADLRAEYA